MLIKEVSKDKQQNESDGVPFSELQLIGSKRDIENPKIIVDSVFI